MCCLGPRDDLHLLFFSFISRPLSSWSCSLVVTQIRGLVEGAPPPAGYGTRLALLTRGAYRPFLPSLILGELRLPTLLQQ